MPPARSRPTISRSCVVSSGEHDAQHGRGDDSDEDRLVALLLRQPGRGEADHDRIVAGQDQVDHDHLEEGRQGLRGQKLAHSCLSHPLIRCIAFSELPIAVSPPAGASVTHEEPGDRLDLVG